MERKKDCTKLKLKLNQIKPKNRAGSFIYHRI